VAQTQTNPEEGPPRTGKDASPVADQAAIGGAVVAAVLVLVLEPGEWGWIDTVIGTCVGLIVCGYAQPQRRTGRRFPDAVRLLAVAAAAALVVCVILAKLIQELFVRRPGLSGDALGERVDNYVLPWVWLGSTIVLGIGLWLCGRVRESKRPERVPRPTVPSAERIRSRWPENSWRHVVARTIALFWWWLTFEVVGGVLIVPLASLLYVSRRGGVGPPSPPS
jgi:hypothetical protein